MQVYQSGADGEGHSDFLIGGMAQRSNLATPLAADTGLQKSTTNPVGGVRRVGLEVAACTRSLQGPGCIKIRWLRQQWAYFHVQVYERAYYYSE